MSHRNGGQRDHKIRLSQRSWTRPKADASDPKVVRGCTGKTGQYTTKHRAREAAVAATKKHGVKFTFYRCRVGCRLYHLTTSKPRGEAVTLESVEVQVEPVAPIIYPPITTSLAGSEVKRMVKRATG